MSFFQVFESMQDLSKAPNDGCISETISIPTKEANGLDEDVTNDGQIIINSGSNVTMADIIGNFGPYQLSLTLLTLIRYICVAMMTNSGPLLAPTLDYSCSVPDSIVPLIATPKNETLKDFLKMKCKIELSNGSYYECSEWGYSNSDYGITLTDTFNLVCERNFLRSLFQSIVSVGVVTASVVWGSFSDRNGRSFTIRVCFICSLLSGIVSYFADNFIVYAISRALCSFGDLGLVVSLSTIIVESLGNNNRGAICIIVYTGWAFGVMIVPWLTDYFRDYRQLMMFTIACHILTLPWLMTVGESVRWSLINGEEKEARAEVRRISKWNCKGDKESLVEVDRKFDKFKRKFAPIAGKIKALRESEGTSMSWWRRMCTPIFGGLMKVRELFNSWELAVTTIALVWTTFNSELLYMMFIMINSDIGDDVKLNYLIGGIMETAATIISIIVISHVTRKFSLIATLVSTSSLCFVLAFVNDIPAVSVWILNAAKLSISTLSSLIYVTTTEVFPTNFRQTGFGFTGTMGSFGAVVAPFIRGELVSLIGMKYVMLILFILPLTAASIIPFFLKETKGVELSDDVDEFVEIEVQGANIRRRSSNLSKKLELIKS